MRKEETMEAAFERGRKLVKENQRIIKLIKEWALHSTSCPAVAPLAEECNCWIKEALKNEDAYTTL